MREIRTMWQIGVLTGKPCIFLVQNGSFSAFWHYKNKERLAKGLDVKCHIPSTFAISLTSQRIQKPPLVQNRLRDRPSECF